MDLFSGTTMRVLEKSLNGAQLRHRAISENIANVDTPNYKAKKVSFQDVLKKELDSSSTLNAYRTHSNHLEFKSSSSHPSIIQEQTSYTHNGASVDIDQEMAELAKNQIYYNSLIDRMNGSFSNLKMVIRGGS
ncbi:flagellar basal body rod protein FlgB [Bacillus sp. TS-2]|nr:flagellar basal body rod protein FlgB [Bacillus sp. TS-2]